MRYKKALLTAPLLFLAMVAVYNANGREIGSYDTQPAKLTAIALARDGTLALDNVVATTPALGVRSAFAVDRHGHRRTAYSVVPAVLAGGLAAALSAAHLVDLREPRAANLIAKLTASVLTALAVALAFLIARRRLAQAPALALAIGLGLGTNYWAQVSQTLWQTETAVVALTGALFCLCVPVVELSTRRLWQASLLLGLAGAARPQLGPAIAILALSMVTRRGRRSDMVILSPLAIIAILVMALNIAWFGHPLGVMPTLEALHPAVHGVGSSLGSPVVGGLGLLFSPSRGLLVFSPILVVALAAWPALRASSWRDDLRWCCAAALGQFAAYACYAVWWGGHTYGPRYLNDVLPLIVPLAAAGLPWWLDIPWRRVVAAVALAWSILIAGAGAFVYPYEGWNVLPIDVDTDHGRLWEWKDPQFLRCWVAGPSPKNLSLFKAAPPR